MPDSTQHIILDELRALRVEFNAFARDTGDRVSLVEADVHGPIGNGRPGRVDRSESAVQRLKQWRWWLIGAAAGGSGVISVIAWAVTQGKK